LIIVVFLIPHLQLARVIASMVSRSDVTCQPASWLAGKQKGTESRFAEVEGAVDNPPMEEIIARIYTQREEGVIRDPCCVLRDPRLRMTPLRITHYASHITPSTLTISLRKATQ